MSRPAMCRQYHVESSAADNAQLDLIVDGEPNAGQRRMRRRDIHFAAYAVCSLDDKATVMRQAPHGGEIPVCYLLNHDRFPLLRNYRVDSLRFHKCGSR